MRKLLSILVAVMAIAALVAVGCGNSGGGGGGSSPSSGSAASELTARAIVKKSNTAMSNMKTVAMNMDMSIAVKGDASKITDPQAKALLSSPITVKMAGNVGNDPQMMDVTLNADAMGQTFDIGLKMEGDTVYLEYNKQWYSIPKDMASSITGSTASPSAAEDAKLTDLYKQLGIDPNNWANDYTIVGEEDVNGVTTYHISEAINIDKIASDLSKLTSSASGLGSIIGSSSTTSPEDLEKQIETMKQAVKDVKVDYWIGKDDFYLYKMSATGMVDFTALSAADREGAEGVDSLDLSLAVDMKDFDKDFTVTPPTDAKPFEQLMNDLMQSGGLSL